MPAQQALPLESGGHAPLQPVRRHRFDHVVQSALMKRLDGRLRVPRRGHDQNPDVRLPPSGGGEQLAPAATRQLQLGHHHAAIHRPQEVARGPDLVPLLALIALGRQDGRRHRACLRVAVHDQRLFSGPAHLSHITPGVRIHLRESLLVAGACSATPGSALAAAAYRAAPPDRSARDSRRCSAGPGSRGGSAPTQRSASQR